MQHHLVLRVMAKLMIPFILVFALYVQFHGDYGPGGGFQAGVIFAAGFILYGLIFGLDNVRQVVEPGTIRVTAALGVILYQMLTGCFPYVVVGNMREVLHAILHAPPTREPQ